MNRLLKWLLYVLLLAAYVWAVFFWDRFPTEAVIPPDFQDAAALSVDEPDEADYDSIGHSDSTVPMEAYESHYPQEVITESPLEGVENVPYGDLESEEPYWVIGGSFSAQDRALQEQARLAGLYISSEVVYMDPYYRLVLGKFSRPAAAQSAVLDMKALGVDAYLMER